MDKVFKELIGGILEVYVDDMLVKTKDEEDLIPNLQKVFGKLREHQMRLNPAKCAFTVEAGKFLGFMLTSRGIEANLEKCQAIISMKQPELLKEVQSLTGRLATLSRFLAASAIKAAPLFKLMRKETAFKWTEECEKVFQSFKDYLASPPILVRSEEGKPLVIYLAATEEVVAGAFIQEREKAQEPVYFISKS